MVNVKHVLAILEELNRHKMEFQFVIKFLVIVIVNQTLLEKTVTNVKMGFGILQVVMGVKTANVIQLDHIIHLVILILDSAFANLVLLG